jgi:hypothetical protein
MPASSKLVVDSAPQWAQYSVMASDQMQAAQAFGITYRNEGYSVVIVLNGDKAYRLTGDSNWGAGSVISIEQAWVIIARRGLKLAK